MVGILIFLNIINIHHDEQMLLECLKMVSMNQLAWYAYTTSQLSVLQNGDYFQDTIWIFKSL